jgi:hypothetical protein
MRIRQSYRTVTGGKVRQRVVTDRHGRRGGSKLTLRPAREMLALERLAREIEEVSNDRP